MKTQSIFDYEFIDYNEYYDTDLVSEDLVDAYNKGIDSAVFELEKMTDDDGAYTNEEVLLINLCMKRIINNKV